MGGLVWGFKSVQNSKIRTRGLCVGYICVVRICIGVLLAELKGMEYLALAVISNVTRSKGKLC